MNKNIKNILTTVIYIFLSFQIFDELMQPRSRVEEKKSCQEAKLSLT